MSDSPPQLVDVRPLTAEELDLLSTISMVGFGVCVLAFVCVVAAASFVAAKTRLPGRFSVLASTFVLPIWWVFEQYMGGSLEMTFGPVALLATLIVYAVFSALFSFGFVRMCMHFLKQPPSIMANNSFKPNPLRGSA